ncbi:Olfactory receptor 2D2, partial [Ophiophagus hannah]
MRKKSRHGMEIDGRDKESENLSVYTPQATSLYQFSSSPWLSGFFMPFGLTSMFRLSFCDSNVINHFFCDIPPTLLLKLACGNILMMEIAVFVFSVVFTDFCIAHCFYISVGIMDNLRDGNQTSWPKEFILMGISNHWVTNIALFVTFVFIYLMAMIGNLLLVLLVIVDSHLHSPMYFFLSNFSVLEACYTSTVVPQMLSHLLSEERIIPLIRCGIQLYFFLSFGITECFLLSVMSYDRYIAICLPLHYSLTITKKVCISMATVSWVGGLFFSAINTAFTLNLSFGNHNKIDHFLCEMPALVKIASGDTHQAKMCMSISCLFTLVLPLLLILASYTRILYSIFGKGSLTGKHKAISTCSSHMMVVSLFFGSVLSIYMQPKSSTSKEYVKMASVFYIIITPALNPLIYSLRNKEVTHALKKLIYKNYDKAKRFCRALQKH